MKKIIISSLFIFLLIFQSVYAQALTINQLSGYQYEIFGSSTAKTVGILVLDPNDNMVEVNQAKVNNGTFTHNLYLNTQRPIGLYKILINGTLEQTFSVTDVVPTPTPTPTNEELADSIDSALTIINSATRESIGRIINRNNSYYGLNLTGDFKNLTITSQELVFSGLLSNYYNSIASIVSDFNRLVLERKNEEAKQTSEPTQPSKGSGGGGTYSPISMPINQTIPKEEVFIDLEAASWAKQSILNLASKGIVSGKEIDKFYPNDNIKREEFVKIIISAFYAVDISAQSTFSDLDQAIWYYPYVATAIQKGIINGIGDNQFGLNNSITRQDLATIIYRVVLDKKMAIDEVQREAFVDQKDISDYATTAVTALYKAQIINGIDGKFAPREFATRAQVAKMVDSILK